MSDTLLGKVVQHPIQHVLTLPVSPTPHLVHIEAAEVSALCPVTHQPDLYHVSIDYAPAAGHVIESKSLKLFLWSYRDKGIACEALAAEIAERLAADYQDATGVETTFTVTARQQSRGGIVLEATGAA